MFGPSIRSVFTSRWKALFWAAGILTTAYCTVPAADEEPADLQQAVEAGQALETIIGHKPASEEEAPVNPWAKEKAKDGAKDRG